jgi:hypothetical protein
MTTITGTNSADLMRQACYADNHYHWELIRVYGAREASDMRYRPHLHKDPDLIAARAAKLAADAAWMDVMRSKYSEA